MPTLRRMEKEPVRKIKEEDRKKIYLSKRWRQLRESKLMNNPLCEICLQKGIIKPAIDIHHIDSFLNYEGLKRIEVAYNYNNLLALCKECHSEIHKSDNN